MSGIFIHLPGGDDSGDDLMSMLDAIIHVKSNLPFFGGKGEKFVEETEKYLMQVSNQEQ